MLMFSLFHCFLFRRPVSEPDDDTPRSPSPEETKRVSTSFVPKAIPDRRTDLDLRTDHSARIVSSRFLSNDLAPRHLRNEPVEIPTAPQRMRPNAEVYVDERDKDYRVDRSVKSDRRFYDERRHQGGFSDYKSSGVSRLQSFSGTTPGTSSKYAGRDVRNEHYARDDVYMSSVSVHPSEHSSRHPVGRSSPWNYQHAGSHGNSRASHEDRTANTHGTKRDVSYHGDPKPSSAHGSSSRQPTSWTPPESSHSARPTASGTHQRGSPYVHPGSHYNSRGSGNSGGSSHSRGGSSNNRGGRSGETSWEASTFQSNAEGRWSNWDGSKRNHGYDGDWSASNPGTASGQSKPALLPRPYAVPQCVSSSSVSNAPSQTAPHGSEKQNQQKPLLPSSGAVSAPARREDPRLANRARPVPLTSNTTAITMQSPPMSSSSRAAELSDDRCSSSSKESTSTGYKKDQEPVATARVDAPTAEKKNEGELRNSDDFMSPLGGLYSGSSKTAQTGRGYGVQTYRIPKRSAEGIQQGGMKRKTSLNSNQSPLQSEEAQEPGSMGDTSGHTDESGLEDDHEDANAAASTRSEESAEEERDGRSGAPLVICLDEEDESEDVEEIPENVTTLPGKQSPSKPSRSPIASPQPESVPPKVSESSEPPSAADNPEKQSSETRTGPSEDAGEGRSVASSDAGACDSKPSSAEKSGRGRPRKSGNLPLEVARLHEDLTDSMKWNGSIESGTRRGRSRTSTEAGFDAGVTKDGSGSSPPPGMKDKRGKALRSSTTPTKRSTGHCSETDAGPDEVPMTDNAEASNSSSTTYSESPGTSVATPAGKPTVKNQRRKKKAAANQKRKSDVAGPNTEGQQGGGAKVDRKRKKEFIPTHISLRGRRSMYENAETSDIQPTELERNNSPEKDDPYLQCYECSYLGQKIVHHYVNEHFELEIPYVTVPEEEWQTMSSIPNPTEIPRCHQIRVEDSLDLSWIPSRPNYQTPVTCKLCPFSACKRSELLEHMVAHALPSNCEYRCRLCAKTETNFFEMYDHVAGHTGEYRYKCNYCDYKVKFTFFT